MPAIAFVAGEIEGLRALGPAPPHLRATVFQGVRP